MLEWAMSVRRDRSPVHRPRPPRLPGVDGVPDAHQRGAHAARRLHRRSAPVGASTAASRSSGTGRCAPATGSTPRCEIADIYAKTGRSGTMVFIVNRMTFIDADGRLGRHRRLAHDQAGLTTMRIEDVELGDELPEERPDVSLETVRRFVKAAQMDFPRFTDHEAARAEGLPGRGDPRDHEPGPAGGDDPPLGAGLRRSSCSTRSSARRWSSARPSCAAAR